VTRSGELARAHPILGYAVRGIMSAGVVASSLVGALMCLMVVFGAPMYAFEGGSESVATVAFVAGCVGVVVSPIFGLFLVWAIWTVDVHE
jgi:hypothetical protein